MGQRFREKQNTGPQLHPAVSHRKCPAFYAISCRDAACQRLYELRHDYSATASFSMTTFKCAVTSLCSFTGTLNSPTVFSGSWSWILRRSTLKPFFVSASPMSLDVTEPKSCS